MIISETDKHVGDVRSLTHSVTEWRGAVNVRYLTQILFVCCLKCFTELRQLLCLLIRADHTYWSVMCWSCYQGSLFHSVETTAVSLCVIERGSVVCLSRHVTCVFPFSPAWARRKIPWSLTALPFLFWCLFH